MAEQQNKKEPIKITRKEADRMRDYAQSLDDEITHVVDYGDVLDGTADTDVTKQQGK